jgi:zinc protease
MLDVALTFDAASSRDGDKFGVAALTNNLIGTETLYKNEEAIIQAFESIGASFSQASLKDMSLLKLRTLTKKHYLRTAVNTFVEVVTQPKFTQKYLTRTKKQTLLGLEAVKQSPGALISRAFSAQVFANHPYAHASAGTQKSIKNMRLQDIKHHYQTYYTAKNLIIVLVGDITQAKAKQIARQISHGLNSGRKPPTNPKVTQLKTSFEEHLEFPSKQTHIMIGQTGIQRTHPDYYALYLGNHILGGSGLNALLSKNIREENALAYSVQSYFIKMKSNGFFAIKLQTKGTQTDKAKTLALKTLTDFLQKPIDETILQEGKDNIIGGFSLQTASNSGILTYLAIIGFYDLPLDYLNNFTSHIKNISALEIKKSFNKLINMDKLIILTLGKSSSQLQ